MGRSVLGLSVLAVLLLAGCSGGSREDTPAAPASAPPPEPPSPPPPPAPPPDQPQQQPAGDVSSPAADPWGG